jgi:phosphoglycerate dehydrogenase-like enzyme
MHPARIGVVIPTPLRAQLFAPADIARLNELGAVSWTESAQQLSVEEAIELLVDCAIGLGSWGTPSPDAQLLEGCPQLRLWVHAAGSVKRMFGPHLEGRDLLIASCGPAIAEDVAEITLGQLIIGLKRTLENAAANRAGPTPKPANGRTLAASTVGVIGASQVGRRVIRNLQPFEPRILLYDPFITDDQVRELGVERIADLLELCGESHAVTLHTPALPATEKLLGAAQFQAMRDDAVFVNTARGMCVDEEALIAELEKGRLFAFLDVSFPEPAAPDSPFRRLPNVVYTSHIAGSPDFKIGRQAVDDIAAFLQGKQPLLAVTADMLERSA